MAESKKNRLGIFGFNDSYGGLDAGDICLIEAMMPHLSRLIVVSQTPLKAESRKKLSEYTTDILELNGAHLPAAYQAGFDSLREDILGTVDEVLFFDRSLFGPIYPLSGMFNQMEKSLSDFWGLHWCYGHKIGAYEKKQYHKAGWTKIPDYIPWSFFAVRKKVFLSREFKKILRGAGKIEDERKAEFLLNTRATASLVKRGFAAEAVLDTEAMRGFVYDPLLTEPLKAVETLKSPLMYTQAFHMDMSKTLEVNAGQSVLAAARHIDKKTDYDINLLWDRLLKTANQHDIKNALGLTFALPDAYDIPEKISRQPKLAVCMHLYYEGEFDACLKYASAMPPYAHIFITTDTQEKSAYSKKRWLCLNAASARFASSRIAGEMSVRWLSDAEM